MTDCLEANRPSRSKVQVSSIFRREVVHWEPTGRRRVYPATHAGLVLAVQEADWDSYELAAEYGLGSYSEARMALSNGRTLIAVLDYDNAIVLRRPRPKGISDRERRMGDPYPACYPHPSAWFSEEVDLDALDLPEGELRYEDIHWMIRVIQCGFRRTPYYPSMALQYLGLNCYILEGAWGELSFTEHGGVDDYSVNPDWFTLVYQDCGNSVGPLHDIEARDFQEIADGTQGVEILDHDLLDSNRQGDWARGLFCLKSDVPRVLAELQADHEIDWEEVPLELRPQGITEHGSECDTRTPERALEARDT